MLNLDDTINAFECCVHIPPDCANCPEQGPGFGVECRRDFKASVLLWLRAQQPRILTLDEMQHLHSRRDVVWLQDADKSAAIPAIVEHIGHRRIEFVARPSVHPIRGYYDDYMRRWCAWTAEPSEEQKRAVKWE